MGPGWQRNILSLMAALAFFAFLTKERRPPQGGSLLRMERVRERVTEPRASDDAVMKIEEQRCLWVQKVDYFHLPSLPHFFQQSPATNSDKVGKG